MLDHTPTALNELYTCPACSFRAVQTTRGLITLDPGDDRAAHLAAIEQAAAQRRAWAERVVGRLRAQYEARAVCCGYTMRLDQLQRLMRWVIAEYAE